MQKWALCDKTNVNCESNTAAMWPLEIKIFDKEYQNGAIPLSDFMVSFYSSPTELNRTIGVKEIYCVQ